MRRHESDLPRPQGHQDTWTVLPWYANGTLHDDGRARVETHLATCTACRAELRRCRALARAVQVAEAPVWEPSPEHLAGLLRRLDAEATPVRRGRGWWHALRTQVERFRALRKREAVANQPCTTGYPSAWSLPTT